MTDEKKQKLRHLLIQVKAIASDQWGKADEDTFVGIYMTELTDIIDDLDKDE